MTAFQKISDSVSLKMKSEVHYKQVAEIYRKSKQYIHMIDLYPILQSTLIDCRDENLIK